MRSKRPVPPHRILAEEDVLLGHLGAWLVSWGTMEAVIRAGDVVPHWEPGMDVRVQNSIKLNDSARDRLGGDATRGMELEAVLVATTGIGLQTVATSRTPLAFEGEATSLELKLGGEELARDIALHLGVVVSSPVAGDRLMPQAVGSRLWSMDWRSRIEGGRARLAMETVDFAEYFGTTRLGDGLLHVVVADDPMLEVEQGLAVYLNARHPGFVAAVSRREPQATAILWDAVMRRAIVAGADLQFSLWEPYPQGSVGAQWQAWAKVAFPAASVEEILDRHRSDVSTFEARIQSWTRMGIAFGNPAGDQ